MPEMNIPVNMNPSVTTVMPNPYPAPQSTPVLTAAAPQAKDSRWLTLEVCREFTRQKCSRNDQECKFAHPPPHVEVQNGRVTCCFDSIKGKCNRKEPPCKYLHPPQHLREQLLQNGRNNLILKQLQAQALLTGTLINPCVLQPTYDANGQAKVQYPSNQQVLTSSPYNLPMQSFPMFQNAHFSSPYLPGTAIPGVLPAMDAASSTSQTTLASIIATQNAATVTTNGQKLARPDRIEANGSSGSEGSYGAVGATETITMASQYPAGLYNIQGMGSQGFPGMVPMVKRQALDKTTGLAVYPAPQQNAFQPQHAMPPFVPVTLPGHPTLQRY